MAPAPPARAPDPRRALSSVNCAALMDDHDMGLHGQPNLAKDSQEMEQLLVDLGTNDLVQDELLQAIKTLESGADNLSTGDTDAIFPLSGFDLPEALDSEGDAAEDKIRLFQARLERRCAFLKRRLRILQARAIGKRVSEEVAQTFDKCLQGVRKDGSGRTSSLKALLKRLETTASLQASAASRTVVGPTYFHVGTSKADPSRSASLGIPTGTFAGLEDTAGALKSHLTAVKNELDSDATLSSSGAESNDEAVPYNNPHQEKMPIEQRALWSWQRTRASIATRWCWLQAQVQELEYKIRQHNDLHRQVRTAKGPVEFEGEPVAYEGPLPGAERPDDDPANETCARIRPLRRDTFKKRKLLQMHNLHIATPKAAKPADIRCDCQWPLESCAVCTGRSISTEPLPPFSTLSPAQRLAIIDPGYHPVLSTIKDVPPSIHLSSLWSRGWFRARAGRAGRRAAPLTPHPSHLSSSHHHKGPSRPAGRGAANKLKRGRPPLSRKIRERDREEEGVNHESRPRPRPSTESRGRQSFDIDNIVIPQSVAANTRPEILHYKEIITPKWRVIDTPESPMNNGTKSPKFDIMSDDSEEDVSESAVSVRHARAEGAERSSYVRREAGERAAVDTAVRPYSPRRFPLPEQTYSEMLSLMPDGHRPLTPVNDLSSPRDDREDRDSATSPAREFRDRDEMSSLSPMSPSAYEGDDPDDVEWNPDKEKDRRKSTYR